MLGLFLKIYNRTISCIAEFTGHLFSDRDTTSSTGMAAGGNGNNQWEWEGNWNKTRLNMASRMGMGMNHWEWEGMGLKKTFPLTSNNKRSKGEKNSN